ncbi:MAG: histidine phosphatase family protein [Ramlibacter sp.]|nr:histidine phosphatase family protein [Ramlibacter sp.]
MTLWLVRHAKPLIDAGLCYGATDVAADPVATRRAAEALAAVLPALARVRSSPRQRCGQLAQALRELRPDLAATPDPRLAEMDFGAWEGQRWDRIDPTALKAWTDDFAHHRPGGGESVAAFMARVADAFDADSANPGDCLWITHAGVIRAIRLLAAGQRRVTRAADWPEQAPAFGQWRRLATPRQKRNPPDPPL